MPDKLKLDKSMAMFAEAQTLVPGGVAGIRRPYNFVQGEYPIFFDRGKGGRIIDVDGNEYIDYLCAYGPIIIGYNEEEIDNAVIEQIRNKGFCFSLTQPMQNDLVRKLQEVIPCCEMAAIVKTGSVPQRSPSASPEPILAKQRSPAAVITVGTTGASK